MSGLVPRDQLAGIRETANGLALRFGNTNWRYAPP